MKSRPFSYDGFPTKSGTVSPIPSVSDGYDPKERKKFRHSFGGFFRKPFKFLHRTSSMRSTPSRQLSSRHTPDKPLPPDPPDRPFQYNQDIPTPTPSRSQSIRKLTAIQQLHLLTKARTSEHDSLLEQQL